MKRSDLDGGTRPAATVPRSGVAAVTSLTEALARRQQRPPSVQETLALDDPLDAPPAARPQLRLVTSAETGIDRFATRFAQAVVEVIGGDRAVYQLMRWTTDGVYSDLTRRSHALNRGPYAPQRGRRQRAQVRSVHVSRPEPKVAEMSIHVRHGARSRAIAARIELIEGRWRCTALEFG